MTRRVVHWPAAMAITALGMFAPAGAIAAPANGAAPAHAAANCRGAQAVVGGTVKCVRVGDKCQKRYAHDYLVADLVCARGGKRRHKRLQLRRASYAEARGGRVLDLGRSGKPTFKQALWYFDQTVAHLPGVKVPRGAVGTDTSGTGALNALWGFRNRLTKAQRAVLDHALDPPGKQLTVLDPTTVTPIVHTGRRAELIGGAHAKSADLSAAVSALSDAVAALRGHGVLFKHPIGLYELGGKQPKKLLALTGPFWLVGKGNECHMSLAPRLLARDIISVRQTIIHEAMHCAIGELSTSARAYINEPPFFDEGLPEWASYRVGLELSGSVKDRGWWPKYLKDPSSSVLGRTYDASGWWSLIEHEGVDPFKILPGLVAAGAGGNAMSVYNAALNAAGPDLVKTEWGPTLAGISGFGPRWDLKGPGETSRSEPDRGTVTETSDPAVGAADAEGADEFKVDLEADLIKVTGPKSGEGYMRDAGGADTLITSGDQEFCTNPDGCVCPDGTELPYPKIQSGDAHVGFATESNDDTVIVRGQSIEKDPGCKGALPDGILALGQDGAVLATFKTGTCSAKAGFTAHATANGYTLDVSIKAFSGYNTIYDLAYGGSDPVFTVKGGAGPYSNAFPPPDAPPAGGAIAFAPKGNRMSLGFIEAFNAGASDGVKLGGAMACTPPKRH